jgi:hypothetical protein
LSDLDATDGAHFEFAKSDFKPETQVSDGISNARLCLQFDSEHGLGLLSCHGSLPENVAPPLPD